MSSFLSNSFKTTPVSNQNFLISNTESFRCALASNFPINFPFNKIGRQKYPNLRFDLGV